MHAHTNTHHQVVQSARITCFRENPIPLPSSGGSNKSKKLKDWKHHRSARPTCIPDSRRVAVYVCINLACTSSISYYRHVTQQMRTLWLYKRVMSHINESRHTYTWVINMSACCYTHTPPGMTCMTFKMVTSALKKRTLQPDSGRPTLQILINQSCHTNR